MTVDIIIPNYNGSHLIKKNIQSVLDSIKEYDSQIIIVDDGSKSHDLENLRQLVGHLIEDGKPVKLVEHRQNQGFSSAVNSGVKNSKADIVVLLNSDVSPSVDFIKSPLNLLKDDKSIFGVGCLDKSHENQKIVKRGAGIARWENGMVQHSEGDVDSDKTFWISGGSSFYRREIYIKLGGMDTIYNPFYWEDIDLSYRAQKADYKIYFDKNSEVNHLHDEGAIKTNYNRTKVTTIAYRNQFIFIWKNITDSDLIMNHIINLPFNIIGAIRIGDTQLVKGFLLALLKLPAIIKKRFFQKRFYKVSDKSIFKRF